MAFRRAPLARVLGGLVISRGQAQGVDAVALTLYLDKSAGTEARILFRHNQGSPPARGSSSHGASTEKRQGQGQGQKIRRRRHPQTRQQCGRQIKRQPKHPPAPLAQTTCGRHHPRAKATNDRRSSLLPGGKTWLQRRQSRRRLARRRAGSGQATGRNGPLSFPAALPPLCGGRKPGCGVHAAMAGGYSEPSHGPRPF